MSLTDLSVLDRFAGTPFPSDFPADQRTFFAPVHDLHGVLLACIESTTQSLAIAMYGYDDDELADTVRRLLEAEHIPVQLTLDSSQAGGVHERTLLARESYPASAVAVGRSEHGAIMHQKLAVIDGLLTVTGSTNWSGSGESKQDNQLTVHLGRPMAAWCRARCDAIHAWMLAHPALSG